MLKELKVLCESGWIRLTWEWADRDAERVRIYYKTNETEQGDGSLFVQEEVLRLPHNKTGKAERRLWNEWGLYTFTIVPQLSDGRTGEKLVKEDVMLGEPAPVFWEIVMRDGHPAVIFPKLAQAVPAGIICLEAAGCVYQTAYEIRQDTVLLFPGDLDASQIHIYARKPYDRAYALSRRDYDG